MLKLTTCAGVAPIISLDQYLLSLTQYHESPSKQNYLEYAVSKGIFSAYFDERELVSEECSYERKEVEIKSNRSMFKALKKQFLDQVVLETTKQDYTKISTVEAFEEASVKYMENFGGQEFVFINLTKGEYIVAPLDQDSASLRKVDIGRMCIIVARPKTFVRFKTGNITSLKKELKSKMRYQSGFKRSRTSK